MNARARVCTIPHKNSTFVSVRLHSKINMNVCLCVNMTANESIYLLNDNIIILLNSIDVVLDNQFHWKIINDSKNQFALYVYL